MADVITETYQAAVDKLIHAAKIADDQLCRASFGGTPKMLSKDCSYASDKLREALKAFQPPKCDPIAPEFCDACDGVGWVEGGRSFVQTNCPVCDGTGIKKPDSLREFVNDRRIRWRGDSEHLEVMQEDSISGPHGWRKCPTYKNVAELLASEFAPATDGFREVHPGTIRAVSEPKP